MYKNIFLTGERGCGKSTLINKVIDRLKIKYCGYRTLQYFINGDNRGYYLHGYVDVKDNYSPISIKTGDKSCISITETFEIVGTEILRKSRECTDASIILLDEIGVLEERANNFKKEIFETLENKKLVLGVIKKKESDFLNQIVDREDTLIINIEDYSKEEMDDLFEQLILVIENIIIKRDKYEKK